MAIPAITVVERDGGLGAIAVAPSLLAVIGEATSGTANQPVLVTKQSQLVVTFTSGPLVEACAELIARGVRCVAVMVADDTSIAGALEALRTSAHQFTHVYHLGDVTSADSAVLDSFCEEMLEEQNRRCQWYGGTRGFEAEETVSEYITAMTTIANAITTKYGSVATGQLWTTSRVDGTEGYAPFSQFYVAQEMRLDMDENSAAVEYSLPNCTAFDADGNLRDQVYIENLHGGLADLKLVTPRTWPDRGTSCYVTAPYLLSDDDSDFKLTNHRAVMNLARTVCYSSFRAAQLNKPVRVLKSTGHILEEDAAKLERIIEAQLAVAVLGKPYASGVTVTVDRNDNLLSGAELELTIDIVPLVFTQNLRLSIGFKNPAIEVV